MDDQLNKLIEEYRRAPEFMFTDMGDVNARGMTGDTLLHAAIVWARSDDVEVLIRAGADVNAAGDLGNTPPHVAASRGLLQIAERLLASGARTKVTNEFGQTPSDIAVLKGHTELATTINRHTSDKSASHSLQIGTVSGATSARHGLRRSQSQQA